MDVGLGQQIHYAHVYPYEKVLILVLVDVGLGRAHCARWPKRQVVVLILVLVDVGLGH